MCAFSIKEQTLRRGDLTFSAINCGWDENPRGEVVMCLHGFPDNARSFRFQWEPLAAAGYRVTSPTLRGYEPSSQPIDNDYDIYTIAEDVLSWMDALNTKVAHLVGHDWGAAIAYTAGAVAPERFLSLSTLAVPHSARFAEAIKKVPRQLQLSWYINFFQLRGLSDYWIERNDWALIKKLWRDWSPEFDLPDQEWNSLRSTFSAPGVKKAMLSYYRQNANPMVMLGLKKSRASEMTTVPVRTLAITGANDGCIATELYDFVFRDNDFPNGLRIERIGGAGHFVHQEKPEAVSELLLQWLKG